MGKYDIRHKEVIRLYLKNFFEIFFPDEVLQFRFETARYMDKELADFFGEEDAEGRVDTLFAIERKNNGRWVSSILHWEQQGKKETESGERIFHYACGIYFRYRKPIIPVVLFTDSAVWRERVSNTFQMWPGQESVILSRFRLIKLKDYTVDEFIKLGPDNPLVWGYLPLTRYRSGDKFQIVVRALKGVLRTEKRWRHRATLISLIEQSVALSDSERLEFRSILRKHLEYSEVNMLESIMDIGIEKGLEKGLEQGLEQGKRETILRHIRALLENSAAWELITNVTGVTAEEYQKMQEASLK